MSDSELKERLADAIGLLDIPGVGKGRYRNLVEAFGSPAAVLSAKISELKGVKGISRAVASQIKQRFDGPKARRMASRVVQLGWVPLFLNDADYPQVLSVCHDAPPLLFREGEAVQPNEKMIAIVGTRHPTERGRMFAFNLAGSLIRAGITVVSGMAEGIDSAAHLGSLDAGGKTVAVWGNSIDIVYPPSNKALAARIKAKGAVYSEYFPDTRPDRAYFPERNRIISGLSEGVVVVEAGRKSGALITAAQALEQGRELFAVPGPPDARMSEGTNTLIKHGARLITSVDDVFEELPTLKGEILVRRFRQLPDLTETEKNITSLFSSGPIQIDSLSRLTRMPVAQLMELLLALELKGVIREISGKRFVLAENLL